MRLDVLRVDEVGLGCWLVVRNGGVIVGPRGRQLPALDDEFLAAGRDCVSGPDATRGMSPASGLGCFTGLGCPPGVDCDLNLTTACCDGDHGSPFLLGL